MTLSTPRVSADGCGAISAKTAHTSEKSVPNARREQHYMESIGNGSKYRNKAKNNDF